MIVLGMARGGAAGAQVPPRYTLRIATPAPEGTTWAHEFLAFVREAEAGAKGDLRIKIVFGGIAGNDLEADARVQRGQLDGVASAGFLCDKDSPTHRALRLVGLFHDPEEVSYVAGQLRPEIEREMRDEGGYVYLGDVDLGPIDLFSRRPLRSLSEIKTARLWHWDQDHVVYELLRAIGFQLVPLPIEAAASGYSDGRHDGFLAVPGAMLAYQWAGRARYASDLRLSYLVGCMLVSNRSFDRLPATHQAALRDATARLRARLRSVSIQETGQLMGGALRHQRIEAVPVSKELRSQLEDEARAARERLGEKLLPATLTARVVDLLARYRQEHSK
jgi:TRAP-type C4-dicarboxylate transport system substrate-binding protein